MPMYDDPDMCERKDEEEHAEYKESQGLPLSKADYAALEQKAERKTEEKRRK